jgi:hypothetical protein
VLLPITFKNWNENCLVLDNVVISRESPASWLVEALAPNSRSVRLRKRPGGRNILKNEIKFYDVPMKDIRSTIQKWKLAHANCDLTDDETLCDVTFEELFPHPVVLEAKLAAIFDLARACIF